MTSEQITKIFTSLAVIENETKNIKDRLDTLPCPVIRKKVDKLEVKVEKVKWTAFISVISALASIGTLAVILIKLGG